MVSNETGDDAEVTPLDRVLSDYFARVDRGEAVDRDAFAREHPDFDQELRDFFEADQLASGLRSHSTIELRQASFPTACGDALATTGGRREAFPGPLPAAFGRYRILQLLGVGGMAEVYLADDSTLARRVAIKTPRQLIREAPEQLVRFVREARASANLRHQNICPVYEAGECEGLPYIAMAYIEGLPLITWQLETAPSPWGIVQVVRKIALAVEAAHRAGVVHRDLKPSNIRVDAEGEPVVMDFGLASIGALATPPLTQEGMILGTPAYMSPEQIRCDWGRVGPASDIYSLGTILFEMLSGRRPFEGPLLATLLATVADHVAAPRLASLHPELDPRLDVICGKMLAKRAEERYASMGEVAEALGTFLNERDVTATETTTSQAPSCPSTLSSSPSKDRHSGRFPPKLGMGLAWAFSVLLLGVIVILIRQRDGKTERIEVPDTAEVRILREDEPVGKTDQAELAIPAQFNRKVVWKGWSAEQPQPAQTPFSADEAVAAQRRWAEHHRVPTEYVNSLGMKFRIVPPGEFLLGATAEEVHKSLAQRPDDLESVKAIVRSSGPQHRVNLSQAYYLATFEVTQLEYEKVMKSQPARFRPDGEVRELAERVRGVETAKLPVEMVSWIDACQFCIQLSRLENRTPAYSIIEGHPRLVESEDGYRLPTEAEWEFACRAGTVGMFPWEDVENGLKQTTWWDGNSSGRTHIVGELAANPFGLFDMHGNVREWCQDVYDEHEYASRKSDRVVNPLGVRGFPWHVSRGGAWNIDPVRTQSPRRNADLFDARRDDTGFRLLLPVSGAPQIFKN